MKKLFGTSKNQSAKGEKSRRSPPKITWEHSWALDKTKNALARSSFRSLPNELVLHVFKFLSVHELGNISLVCRAFKMLADQDEVWKSKTKCEFDHLSSIYIDLNYCSIVEATFEILQTNLHGLDIREIPSEHGTGGSRSNVS